MTIYKKTVDGFNWILDADDGGIGKTILCSNTTGENFSYSRECVFMNIINTTIKPGMTCIDLGANIGYATLFMLRNAGKDGFVYAIEPDDNNVKFLIANINENNFLDPNRVEIIKCVITDNDGMSSFWLSDKPNLNSVKKTKHSIKEESVPCYSLSTFCKTRKYPNFIKMDIEGHEVSVFEGGFEYFKENRGITHILLEIHPHFYNEENDFEKVLRKYFDIGFKCSYVVSTPVPNPRYFVENGYKPIVSVQTDGFVRGLYENISNEDLIQIACKENLEIWPGGESKKIARSIMISRVE